MEVVGWMSDVKGHETAKFFHGRMVSFVVCGCGWTSDGGIDEVYDDYRGHVELANSMWQHPSRYSPDDHDDNNREVTQYIDPT